MGPKYNKEQINKMIRIAEGYSSGIYNDGGNAAYGFGQHVQKKLANGTWRTVKFKEFKNSSLEQRNKLYKDSFEYINSIASPELKEYLNANSSETETDGSMSVKLAELIQQDSLTARIRENWDDSRLSKNSGVKFDNLDAPLQTIVADLAYKQGKPVFDSKNPNSGRSKWFNLANNIINIHKKSYNDTDSYLNEIKALEEDYSSIAGRVRASRGIKVSSAQYPNSPDIDSALSSLNVEYGTNNYWKSKRAEDTTYARNEISEPTSNIALNAQKSPSEPPELLSATEVPEADENVSKKQIEVLNSIFNNSDINKAYRAEDLGISEVTDAFSNPTLHKDAALISLIETDRGRTPQSIEEPIDNTEIYNQLQSKRVQEMNTQELQAYFNSDPLMDSSFQYDSYTHRVNLDKARIEKKKEEETKTVFDSVKEFYNSYAAALVNENMISSTIAKMNYSYNADRDDTIDANFDPRTLPDFQETVKKLGVDVVEDIITMSNNAQDFYNKTGFAEIQSENRNIALNYFANNPVKGFVALGAASSFDLVNFIPVSKFIKPLANIKQFSKLTELGAVTKAVLSNAGENVVQDLLQEAYLSNTNDVRKWSSGDILVGMSFSAVLGGIVGGASATRAKVKFNKDIQTYVKEKNVDELSSVIANAERRGDLEAKDIQAAKALRDDILSKVREEKIEIELAKADELAEASAKQFFETQRELILKDQIDNKIDLQEASARLATLKEDYKTGKIKKRYFNQELYNNDSDFIDLLGLPEDMRPRSVEDFDELLGIRIDENPDFSGGSVGAQKLQTTFTRSVDDKIAKELEDFPELANTIDATLMRMRDNPALGLSHFKANPRSAYANFIRATKLEGVLNSDTARGRLLLRKSSFRHSDYSYAASLYDWLSPDGMGRSTAEGRFSPLERSQQLNNIYGGQLREIFYKKMDDIKLAAKNSQELRSALGLSDNSVVRFMETSDIRFQDDVSKLLRDELIAPKSSRLKYGDEVGEIIEDWAIQQSKLDKEVLALAKQAGVKDIDKFYEAAKVRNTWFHRRWDGAKILKVVNEVGKEPIQHLVTQGVLRHANKNGLKVTAADLSQINIRVNQFVDRLLSKQAGLNWIEDIIDIDGFLTDIGDYVLKGYRKASIAVGTKVDPTKFKINLDLDASVNVNGKTMFLKDLLESNIVTSTDAYINEMAARIASAENGITDINDLSKWADLASSQIGASGDLSTRSAFEKAIEGDLNAFRRNSVGARVQQIEGGDGLSWAANQINKFNASRLLHYTGISSIAELGSAVGQTNIKTMLRVVMPNFHRYFKRALLGGLTGDKFKTNLQRELNVMTGKGLEGFHFDQLYSDSSLIFNKSAQGIANKTAYTIEGLVIPNSGKLMGKTTRHIEGLVRDWTINMTAYSFSDVALGKATIDSLWGGVSKQNLLEWGLGTKDAKGIIVPNDKFKNIVDHIRKFAIDKDGKSVLESGKEIDSFQPDKWDYNAKKDFTQALTQWNNHILVDPDSTTQFFWQNSLMGSLLTQFKSFSFNAATKVSGHTFTNAVQGLSRGEAAEAFKAISQLFWSTAFGAGSLILYGATKNAGREDFAERMQQYLAFDDPRFYTRALGRSSLVSVSDFVFDTAVGSYNILTDSNVKPFFDYSTVGQSRNLVDPSGSPLYQVINDASAGVKYLFQGDTDKAAKKAWKLAPFRQSIIINQILNAMGAD